MYAQIDVNYSIVKDSTQKVEDELSYNSLDLPKSSLQT